MARNKRVIPEINAGSMADIAFLLLIFFLVTTTMDVDKGLMVKLPPWTDVPPDDNNENKKRNTFIVLVNANNELLVGRKGDEKVMQLDEIRPAAVSFINNNGDGSCTECQGSNKDPRSSENPSKAIISIQHDRGTSYQIYVKVRNELLAAYTELRDDVSVRKFGAAFKDLPENKQEIVAEIYPQFISEAEPL